ncbi:unnamed protein product [Sphacelaria rigidula]
MVELFPSHAGAIAVSTRGNMRRAANGIATALRRPASSFPSCVKESSFSHPNHSFASSTAQVVFHSLPLNATVRGGGSILVRRCMSSGSVAGAGGGDSSAPSKYMEKEAQIRESQKMVRTLYKEGSYQDALDVTQRLVDLADDLFGRKHGVYASALNDQALMLKSVGELAAATDTYLKALEVYREAYKGEENASFAATLHNLGMTFRTMAQQGNTLEKIPLLERAQETFQRCVEIREKILPNNHPDLQLARSRLAMVQGLLGEEKGRTEARLRAALDGLEVAVGEENASTATAMTNLALFLKGEGQFDEAQDLYTRVVRARTVLFGEGHVDVIVAMYNLAELHRAAGREAEALKIQDEIITIVERVDAEKAAENKADGGETGSHGEGDSGKGSVEEAINRVGQTMHARDDGGGNEPENTTWSPEQGKDKRA